MSNGLFVSLEGIDACGKTTTAKQVVDLLNSKGFRSVLLEKKSIEYPTFYLKLFMKKFKDLLWDYKMGDPVTEISDYGWINMHALWYDNMYNHMIKPNLEKYEIVLLDSWYQKILTRYMLKENFNQDLLNSIFSHLPEGDLTIMLDVSPQKCWERREHFKVSELGGHDDIEGSPKEKFCNYQNAVRKKFLSLSENKRNWVVLNTEHSNEKATAEIVKDTIVNHLVKEGSIV